jgi:hypothetical protein
VKIQPSNPDNLVKLHLGCGSKYLSGWINIDKYDLTKDDGHRGSNIMPDVWHDINCLDEIIDEGSVDIIYSSHVIEHFYAFQTIKNLRTFRKLLKRNGVLIIETPDLDRVKIMDFFSFLSLPEFFQRMQRKNLQKELYANVIHNDQGDQVDEKILKYCQLNKSKISTQYYGASWEANELGYPYHKYVWSRQELVDVLTMLGFKKYLATSSTISHVPIRDMLLVFVNRPKGQYLDCNSLTMNAVNSFIGSGRKMKLRQLKVLAGLLFRF